MKHFEGTSQCPQCGAVDARILGNLGKLTWVRCQACGWDYTMREV